MLYHLVNPIKKTKTLPSITWIYCFHCDCLEEPHWSTKGDILCSSSREIQQKTGWTVTTEDIRQTVLFISALLFCKSCTSLFLWGGLNMSLHVCVCVCVCVWPTFFFNITAKQMKYFTKFERHTQTHTRFLSFFSLSFTFYLLQGPNVSRQSFARVDISFWYMSASDCVNGCMCVFGFERSVCAYSRYKFAFCTVYTCYCKNVYSVPAEIFLLERDKHKEFNIIKTSIYRWWPLTKAQ